MKVEMDLFHAARGSLGVDSWVYHGILPTNSAPQEIIRHEELRIAIMRLSPAYLLQEVSLAVLNPAVRIMGPLSPERLQGFIPSPLSLQQSLMVVWPQLTVLAALSIVCFGVSYVVFMRREVRS